MKKVIVLLIIVINPACIFVSGQVNLITNGSFENFAGPCPTNAPNGLFYVVYNWKPANDLPTYGMPSVDLYCGGPNYGNCLPGPVPMVGSDGLAYAGFHTRILTPVYNEAIYQVLNAPLTAGVTYTISMDLITCQTGLFTNGPSDFCVYTNIDTVIPACPSTNPSVILAGCVPFDSLSNTTWKNHSFTFVAPANANIIAFSGGACFTNEVYYYVDNIILTELQQQPVVNFYSSDTSFCDKKCLDFFDISTNNPTSWQWLFPGADSISSNVQNPSNICYNSYGSFDVTLIACNAIGCDTLVIPGFINEYQPPSIPVISGNFDTLFCTTAFAYQWYNSNGLIPGATNPYYIYSQLGSYYVIVTDSNGCASSSNVIYAGIDEITSNNDFLIYPNPANSTIEINLSNMHDPINDLYIINSMGQEVWRMNNGNSTSQKSQKITVNTQNFSNGIYMLKSSTASSNFAKRFVVMHE